MKVLYVHPRPINLGDTFVEAGAKYLFQRTFGFHHFHTTWFDALPFEPYMRYDIVAALGTPWFWHRCKETFKYDLLHLLGDMQGVRAVIGAGASYPLGDDWSAELAVDPVWRKFKVICRDHLTAEHLPGSPVLACPSLFSAQAFGVTAKPDRNRLLIYYGLTPTNSFWFTDEDRSGLHEFQDKLIVGGAEVITIHPDDQSALQAAYPTIRSDHYTDPEDLLKRVALYQEVWSARVHGCAAALSLGLKAYVWPVDTRALTVTGCGAVALRPLPSYPTIVSSEAAWHNALRSLL